MKLKIRTKNKSAKPLVGAIDTGKKKVVFRLGSLTPTSDIFIDTNNVIEINTVEACHNSGDKILMKTLFEENNVKSAPWCELKNEIHEGYVDIMNIIFDLESSFPAIIKHKNSCKGHGIFLINNQEELDSFIAEKGTNNYIIEKYYNYSKEYRLHVTKNGCFYACRKMLKEDAEERWHRHDMNSVWIVEENQLFEKPSNWELIVEECVKALNAVGLDVGACDVKVQSEKNYDRGGNPEFIILEINSAPSMGEITLIKYKEMLSELVSNI